MILKCPSHESGALPPAPSYKTIAYIDSTEAFNNKTGTKPTCAINDLIIVQMIEYDQSTGVFTQPAGFTKITGSNGLVTSPNVTHQELAYKIIDGSEGATISWTSTTGGYPETLLTVYRDIDLSNPIDVAAQVKTGSGTSVTTTSITPITPQTKLLLFHGGYSGSISVNPTGMTQREINDGVNYIFDEARTDTSAITKSYTITIGDNWVNAVVLLRPALA